MNEENKQYHYVINFGNIGFTYFHQSLQDLIGATKHGDIKSVTDILEQSQDSDTLIQSRESDEVCTASYSLA